MELRCPQEGEQKGPSSGITTFKEGSYANISCITVYVHVCAYVRRPLLGVGQRWVGAAGAERGYPEPFVLLERPAQNPGCSCVVAWPCSSGAFFGFFVFLAVSSLCTPLTPPLDPPLEPLDTLDPPWTPGLHPQTLFADCVL